MLIFNEAEKQSAIKTTFLQWESFKTALVTKGIAYNEVERALQETFLKVFDDLFYHTRHLVMIDAVDVHMDNSFFRAVQVTNETDKTPSHQRFIPDASKGGSNNRFSPKGIEWLYLGTSKIGCNEDDIRTGCIREVHAKGGDDIALCRFEINRKFRKNRNRNFVVDLTVADDISYDEINDELIKPASSQQEYYDKGKTWTTKTYMKMLSSEIFIPLSDVDSSIEYLPFQCVAQYFVKHNLCGIIYKSTVYENSRNIVFFNKNIASPVGDVEPRRIV